MGLPSTMRGATTPEQIYEYLAGAYFGSKERPWYKAKAVEGIKEFEKQSQNHPKLEWEKNPKEMEGFEPSISRKSSIPIRLLGATVTAKYIGRV